MDNKRKKLIEITKESGAFKTGKFVLSSGKESNIYFDGRITSLLPESLEIISEILFEDIKKHSIDVIAGPTLGADAIVAGVLMIAAREKFKLKGAIVRKETKTHGNGKMVEGNYVDGDKVDSEKIFSGYILTQELEISSNEVDLIEKISNEVTDLIEKN